MKKLIVLAAAFALLSGCSAAENSSGSTAGSVQTSAPESSAGQTERQIQADYLAYDTLQALEDQSDLILRCSFAKREGTEHEGTPYTRVTVKVKEVYQGDAKNGEDLIFLQMGTNEEEKNPVICNAYIPMQTDQDYVLFLTKSGDEYFMPSPAQSCYLWADTDQALQPALDSGIALSLKVQDLR